MKTATTLKSDCDCNLYRCNLDNGRVIVCKAQDLDEAACILKMTQGNLHRSAGYLLLDTLQEII